MHVRLIAVDKLRSRAVAELCDELRKRLAPYGTYETIDVRAADGSHPETAMREEAARILKVLRPDDRLWVLERTGVQLSSEGLAAKLDALALHGAPRLTLAIAGTYGAAPELIERAEFLWSLSQLTFLHEWARALVLEQLYRAAKIARNEP